MRNNIFNKSCCGDCKNCKCGKRNEGAYTETAPVFDEALFQEAVTMLGNMLKLTRIKDDYPDSRIVMMIHPEYEGELMTAEYSETILSDLGDYSEVEAVFDELLMLRYNEDDVVELGGVRYLLGMAEVFEIDDDGNECSIDFGTMQDASDYVAMNLTEIMVDGKTFPALRLI